MELPIHIQGLSQIQRALGIWFNKEYGSELVLEHKRTWDQSGEYYILRSRVNNVYIGEVRLSAEFMITADKITVMYKLTSEIQDLIESWATKNPKREPIAPTTESIFVKGLLGIT